MSMIFMNCKLEAQGKGLEYGLKSLKLKNNFITTDKGRVGRYG